MTNADPIIAVVDDDASVRTALGRLLRLADWHVVAFASGKAFLASMAAHRFDCVILAVNMPGLSGFDVQARLREEHIGIPVVFITASDDVILSQTAVAAGGVKLLRKPFSSDALIEAVRAALLDPACDPS